MIKSKLPVMWRLDAMSWCTRQFFVEWVYDFFCSRVNVCLKEKQLTLSSIRKNFSQRGL